MSSWKLQDLQQRIERKMLSLEQHLTRWQPLNVSRVPHDLPADLVVSLTSYPPRFDLLRPTLHRLLSQTVRPDKVMLWVAEADYPRLPSSIAALEKAGLTIGKTQDYGPHKKYYDTRRLFPDAFIVTVDDDVSYRPTMLAELIAAYDPSRPAVVAHRARRIVRRGDFVTPYWEWPLVETGGETGDHILPTGVGGVLYPPGSLPDATLDVEAIMRLCPSADDMWLLWMSRRAGYTAKMVAKPVAPREWNGAQDAALWNGENQTKHDIVIRALWNTYGPPVQASPPC